MEVPFSNEENANDLLNTCKDVLLWWEECQKFHGGWLYSILKQKYPNLSDIEIYDLPAFDEIENIVDNSYNDLLYLCELFRKEG